ncbi:MAG TPA: sigma-70 family RNA polymerase sigma factor, partial [Planctomycetota bacterium]|nr:sigma-70 family RNA polymerase sigma factor [Planctomycetota bacterium]
AEASVPLEQAAQAFGAVRQPLSLDRPVAGGEDDSNRFGEFLEDRTLPAPTDTVDAELLRQVIGGVLATLPPREGEILKLRFGIGTDRHYTLEEVGRIFKITRERVRQLEMHAIQQLQASDCRARLGGFLDRYQAN